MKVLIACEFSGVIRDAFRHKGHEAWSCDLEDIEPEGHWPNYHLFGDCRLFLDNGWDIMIAHPPCTYLCNSGVRWLYGGAGNIIDQERWDAMILAAEFIKELRQAPIQRICIENPIMHRYGKAASEFSPSQTIHPWMFGHGETKATCLELKNLPRLSPTNIVSGRNPKVHYASPSKDRWKVRSRTLSGIGQAMAEQWGGC